MFLGRKEWRFVERTLEVVSGNYLKGILISIRVTKGLEFSVSLFAIARTRYSNESPFQTKQSILH